MQHMSMPSKNVEFVSVFLLFCMSPSLLKYTTVCAKPYTIYLFCQRLGFFTSQTHLCTPYL